MTMSKESIGIGAATAVGIGGIIGAGIFVLSGTAIALAGVYSVLAFLLVGAIMIFVSFEFGELATIMPNAKGAAYSYAREAFGSELGFVTGIIQFFGYSTAISAIALGFGSYMYSLIGMHYGMGSIDYAIVLILIACIVNLKGVGKVSRAESILVAFKIAILIIFVLFAIYLTAGKAGSFVSNFSALPSQSTAAAFFAASIAIIFAYSGFQSITTFASRIKGGSRGAAKAVITAVVASMVIYLLVVVALIAMVPATSYKINADPLSFALTAVSAPQWIHILVNIGALVATTTAALAMMIAASRILYQIGVDGLLPHIVRRYDAKADVPINGVLISAGLAIVMLFAGNIYVIASISNFGSILAYVLASMAIIHFRRIKSVVRKFSTPLYPWTPAIVIIFMLIYIASMPPGALYLDIVIIIGLIVVYYMLREKEHKRPVRIRFFR